MVQVYGLKLHCRNMSILVPYWIGSDLMLNRRGISPFAGKHCSGPLILLVITLFGRLGMGLMSALAWIHGLDVNGDTYYLIQLLINYILLGFFSLKILHVLEHLS